jgi:hypothetical protein
MNIHEIIGHFENKFISKRIEFIEDYSFSEDLINRNYFVTKLKEIPNHTNYWYQALLIDIATDLEIHDEALRSKYFSLLSSPNHYLVQLSVLDYLIETYSSDNSYSGSIEPLMRLYEYRNTRIIVKSQLLLLLILIDRKNLFIYKNNLANNLYRTNNYQGHLRVYNSIIHHSTLFNLFGKYLLKLTKISRSTQKGRAVQSKLIEVEQMLK